MGITKLGGKITLEPAFGESIEANLAIVSACSFQGALTTSLGGPTLLLLDDFNFLNDQTLTALPDANVGVGMLGGKMWRIFRDGGNTSQSYKGELR